MEHALFFLQCLDLFPGSHPIARDLEIPSFLLSSEMSAGDRLASGGLRVTQRFCTLLLYLVFDILCALDTTIVVVPHSEVVLGLFTQTRKLQKGLF